MFKNVKLISVERVQLGNEEGWNVLMEIDNPKYLGDDAKPPFNMARCNLIHTIPDSAIVWRAAELEVEDMEAVLDVLLTENYIREANPPTAAEHISRCAAMKLSMRLSTRENKSVLRARAASPEDPMTTEEAEQDHPLSPLRSFAKELPRDEIEQCRALLRRQRLENR